MILPQKSTILFQGDSITDCGRTQKNSAPYGNGYVNLLLPHLKAQNHTTINRGISGDRLTDMLARWQKETLDLQPNTLSILAGINNVWRRYDNDDPTTTENFLKDYTNLLTQVRDQLNNVQLILCEPFLLHINEERKIWREDLDPKIDIVHQLAKDFDAILIPFDKDFQKASNEQPPAHWAEDGVHPTHAGHQRMADLWKNTIQNA